MLSYYWENTGVSSTKPLGTGFYARASHAPARYTYQVHKPLDECVEVVLCFEFQSDELINGSKAISIANSFTDAEWDYPAAKPAWIEDEELISGNKKGGSSYVSLVEVRMRILLLMLMAVNVWK